MGVVAQSAAFSRGVNIERCEYALRLRCPCLGGSRIGSPTDSGSTTDFVAENRAEAIASPLGHSPHSSMGAAFRR
jgi:hypothetical protein